MKQRDLAVFDFNEEDELTESYHQWSELSNPKCHIFHHGKDGSKQSEEFCAVSDNVLQERCHFSEDSIKPKCSSLSMEIRVSSPFGFPSGNGHISPIPESPCSNDSVDAGASDGRDSIQDTLSSTSASELEDNTVPIDEQAQDQSFSGLEMQEEMDTIVLHADYITYGDKYFPASVVLISKNCVKIKTSVLEEFRASISEWKIDDILSIESQWSGMANIAKVKVHLLTKDAGQAENAQGTSAVEVLEFLVHDPHWSRRQELIMSLDTRYKAVWSIGLNGQSCDEDAFPSENSESSDPYIPNFEEPFEEVVYPNGDVDAVSISKRDVDLLQPEIFINDTIIDFYIKYLKNEIPSQERHRFHFFNSFFFRKLADLDKNPSSVFDGKAAFQRVRKWTRKVNIFEKDYIFIPVNYNLHWSLIVICHPGEVANFDDVRIDEALRVPCILHMDSIRGSHIGLRDLVQSYLLEEWKERQKETCDDICSKFLNLRFLSLELPQQENCSDCGLFLLHYVELFIAEAPENFSPFQINKFDNFLKLDWFMPAEASLKRVHIKRLIYELLERRSLENTSPSGNHESHSPSLPENNENDNAIEIISEKKSPGKSWNGNLSYSQPVQGMEMGLLDMSLYRNSPCINDSGLGLRELLEQCQHYDHGASFGQLGGPLPPIREEAEADEHLADSTVGQTGLRPIGGVPDEACHIDCAPRDFNEGIPWNSELSDQVDPEGKSSSPTSTGSSDDCAEMMITKSQHQLEMQEPSLGQNDNFDQSKENTDSLTESYASASSDVMETPAEDSQELAKIYGGNDEDPLPSDQEEDQDSSQQEPYETEGDGGVDERLEAEALNSDDEQAAKRIRLTPLGDEEREPVRKLR